MAKIIINKERCKGCGLCIDTCPKKLITVSEDFNAKGYHFAKVSKSAGGCLGCRFCAIICPDVAIEIYQYEVKK
ncbi:MAG: tungsten formylmethanofuran dehydrogenase [bacterium (Candidatus Ratteibacteria) CG_4_10_14_3_um_filter_41_18]|uniref:Tungsten formylmethanofuran dehydrogenase n=4 Tax=Candidatus Ratteibacteria TaxID=2979319 RepID=A0A2M7YFH0_9BACT|nr:MAG: hypothetical protein AUJ76_02315 [Candidatus Omnitrophica bacterium CG1_02_41_171]PIV63368.1 MAG: tungsten formylmethanofuran dehydrogenase [bacterium (Candidatus Ratteibacteria) CG01_land_8_20_14_3_00_40_19]PIW30475.1 MAG: tungsten formylmethanofuran dehydrogenase [bacterium (Candidatus Ratteibacteria) CG15_BIG_FIL_POST_REV_8_21_14_020_41_12]PIW74326.1 MAG: tungsten formylmethanofuran dehydrogenase [bacterium (Candidatus Ratteibacteria) CG_4_8_14_3_um_filter_41_36]PIX77678.1 MAG: tungs